MPDYLVAYQPDRVIVMNSIYRDEITAMLAERGVGPIIATIVDPAQVCTPDRSLHHQRAFCLSPDR